MTSNATDFGEGPHLSLELAPCDRVFWTGRGAAALAVGADEGAAACIAVPDGAQGGGITLAIVRVAVRAACVGCA